MKSSHWFRISALILQQDTSNKHIESSLIYGEWKSKSNICVNIYPSLTQSKKENTYNSTNLLPAVRTTTEKENKLFLVQKLSHFGCIHVR